MSPKIKLPNNLNKNQPNNQFNLSQSKKSKPKNQSNKHQSSNKHQLLLKSQFNKKSQSKSQSFKPLNQLPKKSQLNKSQLKDKPVSKNQFKVENKDTQEETTELEVNTEVQDNPENKENQESQDNTNQDNPENQEPKAKKVKKVEKEEDTNQTSKDPTTNQRTKLKETILTHLSKENQPWEPSRRKKSDNWKMMDSKLSASQNQKPRKDKKNGTTRLTARKLITTTKPKTDCTSENKNFKILIAYVKSEHSQPD